MISNQDLEVGHRVEGKISSFSNSERSNFGNKKDDTSWRLAVKQWLIERDSSILDLSTIKNLICRILEDRGIDVKDSFKPSEQYRLYTNTVEYNKKPVQPYYFGYEPKNKSYPYICIEYTSEKKYLRQAPFTYVRVFPAKTSTSLEELMDDLARLNR